MAARDGGLVQPRPQVPGWDAIVLAGGRGARLGGVDKPGLVVGGVPMLDRVLDAVAGATSVVVVGPRRPTRRPVLWTLEDPPGGGPVAGIAAGLGRVTAARVVLLAADLPLLTAAVPDLLLAALDNPPGRGTRAPVAVAVDPDGREQHLLAAWDSGALRAALPPEPAGARARDLLPADAVRVVLDPTGGAWRDCDTPQDLLDVRRRLRPRD